MKNFSEKKSTLFFWLLCIPLRVLLSVVACLYPTSTLVNVLAWIMLLVGLNMIRLWLFDLRLSAPEGRGNTWWNSIRPIFAILYILFAMYTFKGYVGAYRFLVADVIIGVAIWFIFHGCRKDQIMTLSQGHEIGRLEHESRRAWTMQKSWGGWDH